jgi:serine/threonine-protein kinase RsbT
MDTKQVLDVLTRYVSPINAQGLLSRATRPTATPGKPMKDGDARELLGRIEQSSRLFVEPHRLADLARELRALLPAVATASRRIELTTERDLSAALQAAREIGQTMGARPLTVQAIATIASELARNVVSYTPGGTLELIADDTARSLLLRASDRGRGIPNLSEILSGRYRSTTGLGKGLVGCSKLAKRFDVKTGPEGTVVEALVTWA